MSTIANKLRRKGRRAYIESYAFPGALRNKLVDELGSAHKADIALDGLRAWYLACLYADGELIGMPSKAVDVAWHEMILRTREYQFFCRNAFGEYLHHTPDSMLDIPMSAILPPTLRIVDDHDLPMVLFTADVDAGMDEGHEWSSTELRRMRDSYAARDTSDARRRRRRTSTSGGAFGGEAGTRMWIGGSDGGSGGDSGGGSSCGGGGGCGGGGCGGGG